MRLFTIIRNFFFCLKYPFWRNTNVWTGKFSGYDYTWYDDIPYGWRKAFGKEMSDEIKKIGKAYLKSHKGQKWKDILYWEQIKEKYGTLRLYAATIKPIEDILTKYEYLSMGYCIECGKPAEYRTLGWVEYVCNDCAKNLTFNKLKRLALDDIPELTRYNYKTMTTQYFKNERDRDEAFENSWKDAESDICYIKENKDGEYLLIAQLITSYKVDFIKEYGIDFKKLWGLE